MSQGEQLAITNFWEYSRNIKDSCTYNPFNWLKHHNYAISAKLFIERKIWNVAWLSSTETSQRLVIWSMNLFWKSKSTKTSAVSTVNTSRRQRILTNQALYKRIKKKVRARSKNAVQHFLKTRKIKLKMKTKSLNWVKRFKLRLEI